MAATVNLINNNLNSPSLDVIDLTTPLEVLAHREYVAGELNNNGWPGRNIVDLTDAIADIEIETVAQGAGTLTISIIDPQLQLLTKQFITTDVNGFLEPIDIVFPKDSNSTWRLVSASPSTSTDANLPLVFEDISASILRDTDSQNGGVNNSHAGETLGHWLMRLVDGANKAHPKYHIDVVEWISPQDPNYTAPTVKHAATAPNGPGSGGTPKRPNGPTQKQINAQQAEWNKLVSGAAKTANLLVTNAGKEAQTITSVSLF